MPEFKPVRWTLSVAGAEFGIAYKTLSERMKSNGILPGPDKKFSTRDVVRAIFTDIKYAEVELKQEQTALIRLKKEQLSGTLVNRDQCQQLWDNAVLALRQKIIDAAIPEQTKQEILKDLQTIPIDEYLDKKQTGSSADVEGEPETA
jgi:hypothetical protein